MNWLLRKFKEPSTWKGLFVLAGIIGYSIDPALQEQIILAVTAVIAVIEIWRNEHKPELPPIELVSVERNRRNADSGALDSAVPDQLPVQPDYSPKEPTRPVDQQPGWNG